jgi:predicted transcriptional regulator
MGRSTYQPDGKVDGFEVDPTERSFTLREIALVQSFSNGIIQDVKNITLQSKISDHTELVILCAFLLAASSDTTRDLMQLGHERVDKMSSGVLSIASLSDMTGIPRQTVRRKCVSLEQKGVIIRDQSRLYSCEITSFAIEAILQQVGAMIKLNARLSPTV